MDTPPNPTPRPSKGLGKLTGHKPIVYVGVFAFAAALAWYIHSRSSSAGNPADLTANGQDPGTSAVTDQQSSPYDFGGQYSGGGAGDYGGYGAPLDYSGAAGAVPDPGYAVVPGADGSVITITSPASLPVQAGGTGGGPPANVDPTLVHFPPTVAAAPNGGQAGHTTVSPGPDVAVKGGGVGFIPGQGFQCGGRYPFESERGCYRVVLVSAGPHKGRWHYYGPDDQTKVKVG